MNQNGVAIIPVILWLVISTSGLIIFSAGTELGYNLVIKNLKESIELTATPPPSPISLPEVMGDTSEATYKQDSKTTAVQNIKPSETPKNDGSRTGRIVKYKEWCKGGIEISVYENELLTKKSSDGGTYSMTQGDWDCYEKFLASKNRQTKQVPRSDPVPQKNTNSYTGEPIIECILSYGTYQLYKSYCEQAKIEDQNTQAALIDCFVYGRTFKLTKKDCDYEQQIEVTINTPSKTNTENPTIKRDYTAYCQNELKAQEQNALARFGGSSSTFFGIQQVYHNSCYPRCLSSGTWPSDCGVQLSQPTPTPNYEGTQVYPWVPQY